MTAEEAVPIGFTIPVKAEASPSRQSPSRSQRQPEFPRSIDG